MAAREEHKSPHFDESAADSELEQYGVWVKVGPEDVSETDAVEDDFALADLSDEDLDSLDEDEFRIDDGMDVSLDIGEAEDDSIEPPEPEKPEAVESLTDDDSEDLLSLEDDDLSTLGEGTDELGLDEFEELEDPDPVDAEPVDNEDETLSLDDIEDTEELPSADSSAADDELAAIDEELEQLDLESIDDEDETLSSIVSDDDLPDNLDDIKLDLDSLDVDDYSETVGAPESAPDSLDVESIDEIGSEQSVVDEPSTETDEDEIEELGGLEDLGDLSGLGEQTEDSLELEEDYDLDLSDLDDVHEDIEEITPEPVEASSIEDEEDAEVVELDLSSLPLDDEDLEEPDTGETDDFDTDLPELETEDGISLSIEEGFDDVAAVEDQMFDEPATELPSAGNDRLSNIESEIAALREQMREISAMHQELQAIQSHLTGAPTNERVAAAESNVQDDDEGLGFFEDEEDETIALTTDELDNIMNTAEFTEQTGQPTDAEAFGILTTVDSADTTPDESDHQDDFEIDLGGGPVQAITLDDVPDDAGTIELDIEQSDSESIDFDDTGFDTISEIDIDAELADVDELEDTSDISHQPGAQSAKTPDEDEADRIVLDPEPFDEELEDDTVESPSPNPEPESGVSVPENLKEDLRLVLSYLDTMLDSLPEDKIQEFADSEHFQTYRNLFVELGLEQ